MRRDIVDYPISVKRDARCGFTLLELLVAIGIIAVLIAVLLPVLGKARAQANRAVCLSNIRQLGAAILMYCNDNNGWFPTCAVWATGSAYKQFPDDWVHWQANRKLENSAIATYVGAGEKLRSLLRCPADTFDGRKPHLAIAPGQGPYLYSYNMNQTIGLNGIPYPGGRTRITQWSAPGRKMMLTESREIYNDAAWWSLTPLAWRHGTGTSRGNAVLSSGQKMGINVSAVFIDGHAEGTNDDFICDYFQFQPWAQ
jgi:prepilin-type N-terminal cleavage/methylation domain-containing protein